MSKLLFKKLHASITTVTQQISSTSHYLTSRLRLATTKQCPMFNLRESLQKRKESLPDSDKNKKMKTINKISKHPMKPQPPNQLQLKMKTVVQIKLTLVQVETHKNKYLHRTMMVNLLTIHIELIMIMKLKRFKLEIGSFIERRVISY